LIQEERTWKKRPVTRDNNNNKTNRIIIIIQKNDMGGACSAFGGGKKRVQCFGGKPEGKRTLARHRCRWEDNIKMDL
jgi:hypothetical protein